MGKFESRAEQSRAEQSRAEQSRAEQSRVERIEWIDNAKGIGLIFVMLGHCYLDTKYTFWFISFHMALFFFLSGYTFKIKGKYFSFFTKKIRTLLIPYLFFVIVTMFCNGFLAIIHGNTYDVIGILKLYLIQNRYTLLWFLTCLFLSEQCMFFLEKLYIKLKGKRGYWLIAGIFELTAFYGYRTIIGINLPWNADLVLIGLAFMSFGKYFCEIKLIEKITWNSFVMGSIFLLLCVVISGYNYVYFGKVDWYSNAYGNGVLYLVSAFSGVVATIFLMQVIKCKKLAILGRNSLIFYGLHRLIIDNLVFVLYPRLGIPITGGGILSLFIAVISVAIAISILALFNYFIVKYIPWCVGKGKFTKRG